MTPTQGPRGKVTMDGGLGPDDIRTGVGPHGQCVGRRTPGLLSRKYK